MTKVTQKPAEEPTQEGSVAAAEPAAATSAPVLTVTEFCRRKSESLRRTELIAAFHADETKAARIKGTAEDFEARFNAFINKPA